MTSLKILQYNTDNLRLGWKYFEKVASSVDIIILQRFPKEKRPELCKLLEGRVFMVESCPPLNLCVALGKTRNGPTFSGTESIVLPSAQHVMAEADSFQGCTALRTVIGNVNIISFLPCYKSSGEYAISDVERLGDIEHILKLYEDEPTVIAGDFHVDPECVKTNNMLSKYGYKSYLDEYKTFKNSGKVYNLDKLVSNIDIEINDVVVHDGDCERGHLAITYQLKYENQKD